MSAAISRSRHIVGTLNGPALYRTFRTFSRDGTKTSRGELKICLPLQVLEHLDAGAALQERTAARRALWAVGTGRPGGPAGNAKIDSLKALLQGFKCGMQLERPAASALEIAKLLCATASGAEMFRVGRLKARAVLCRSEPISSVSIHCNVMGA
jgi:hypothetical protein